MNITNNFDEKDNEKEKVHYDALKENRKFDQDENKRITEKMNNLNDEEMKEFGDLFRAVAESFKQLADALQEGIDNHFAESFMSLINNVKQIEHEISVISAKEAIQIMLDVIKEYKLDSEEDNSPSRILAVTLLSISAAIDRMINRSDESKKNDVDDEERV